MWNSQAPIGLQLSQTARIVSRGFDDALDQAGGSLPVWLILLNLTIRPVPHQRALAEAVGITGATLTHHLNAMEKRGLITRQRDPENRRVHVVELTEEGRQSFVRLRQAAMEFTSRLNAGFSTEEVDTLSQLLGRLAANAGGPGEGTPPWEGLAEGK
ncbi:MarR family transcriptional regulator [Kitasatospora sp. RB6PN24]|uniref:MarR family winged helix-turn-helix transcriptional regulator n=1 Tax=Kitasatospora humi TaxID=2893891 RepID=UPI001E3DCDC8|nr:MarR family transcriptional regulator [Kitasatospora humi]MCC9308372.1 MarR family transcriptional regulator [Kitasatospora humi]